MGDGELLMRAIVDDPDDIGLRLVYADWLEEHGEAERAEFIRVQCQLEELNTDVECQLAGLDELDAQDRKRDALEQRERFLYHKNQSEERLSLPPKVDIHIAYRWGLPCSIGVSAADFVSYGESLLGRYPITEVSLSGLDGWAEKVARCRHLVRVRSLDCGEPNPRDAVRPLLFSPYLTSLRKMSRASFWYQGVVRDLIASPVLSLLEELDLSKSPMPASSGWGNPPPSDPEGLSQVEVLSRGPRMERLISLDLHYNALGDAGAQMLASSQAFPSLKRLHMGETLATAGGLRSLAQSRHFPDLTGLIFSDNYEAGREGLDGLANSPLLQRVIDLNLSSTDLPPSAARVLATANGGNLRALDLTNNNFNAAAAKGLLFSSAAANLWVLSLKSNPLGDEGAEALAASPRLIKLRSLNLSNCDLTPWGVKALASSPNLRNLTSLDLGGNRLSDACLQALTAFPHLSNLRELSLTGNHLTDEGMKYLRDWASPPRLRFLCLMLNRLTDDGLKTLAASPVLRGLSRLYVSGNDISEEGIQVIRNSPCGDRIAYISSAN